MICMPIGKPLSVRAIGIVVDGSPFKGAARHRADHRKVTADRDRRPAGEPEGIDKVRHEHLGKSGLIAIVAQDRPR